MNHNQQSNDDETALTDFLASLTDYTPTVRFHSSFSFTLINN